MKLNINGKFIEVSDEDLTKALEEKKESFDLTTDFIVRTTDENEKFVENTKKDGLTFGAEIGRKEILKKMGIESEGAHRSDDSALASINALMKGNVDKALTDAKIEPNKKVDEMTKDLTTLRGTIETLTSDRNNAISSLNMFEKKQTIKSEIFDNLPENLAFSKKRIMGIINDELKFDTTESGFVFGIGVDGQPLKNPTTLEFLPIKDVMGGFFNENTDLLTKASGGAGGGDSSNAGGKQTIDEFIKEQGDAGVSPNSPKFTETMNERIKAGTLDV